MRRLPLALLAAPAVAALASAPGALGAPPAAPPRFSQLPRASLPPRPAPSSAPLALSSDLRLPWLTSQALGAAPPEPAPARRGPARASKPAAAPLHAESHLRLTTDGCLRRAQENADQQAAETLVVQTLENVVPIQAERLLLADGSAQLELRQFWYDARSQGAREIASVRLPLARLLPTRHGLDVWGFVADGSLHVLIAPASLSREPRAGALLPEPCSLTRQQLADRPGGQQIEVDMMRTYWAKIRDNPELIGVQHTLRAVVSLSRASRDPEPLLAVGLRRVGAQPTSPPIVD